MHHVLLGSLCPAAASSQSCRSRSRYHACLECIRQPRSLLANSQGQPRFLALVSVGTRPATVKRLNKKVQMGLESTRRSPQVWEALMTTTTSANPATPTPRDGSSRVRRLRRTLYRGDPGMWSWVLHRITGATIFFFLFIHVLDTALVRVSPQAYDEVIATYKTPIVGLDGARAGGRGALPRAQRHPRHPDRLLGTGHRAISG